MSSDISLSVFSPMYARLKEGMERNLPGSSTKARCYLESAAMVQLASASLKNFPFVFLNTEFGLSNFSRVLSARAVYLEAAFISAIVTVHNLFFALVYTGLSIATLGFSREVNLQCRIHWAHFSYGLTGAVIAMVGVADPYWGLVLNALHVRSTVRSILRSYENDVNLFERPFLQGLKKVIRDYSSMIHSYIRAKSEEARYKNYYQPSLWYMEKELQAATRMEHLFELIDEFRLNWTREYGLIKKHNKTPDQSQTSSPTAVGNEYYD